MVTVTVVTISPGRPNERPGVTTRTWLVNPGVDIPADATAIHGITTEQARRDGRPAAEVSAEVSAFLAEVWTTARLRARAASARSWPLLSVTTAGSQPVQRRRSARPGGPTNSHASWTPDQHDVLREEWLAADPSEGAETLRKDIASRHGRSPGAIRSRLLRLRCDPELPGQTCDEHRAAHLKQIHDAEYGRN